MKKDNFNIFGGFRILTNADFESLYNTKKKIDKTYEFIWFDTVGYDAKAQNKVSLCKSYLVDEDDRKSKATF